MPDGTDVAPGAVGELWCRGPYTLRGYFRAPERNREAFTADGFYRTGDLVRLDPSGNLVVEGRIKDLINRGGEKISAEEIEAHLIAHPAVSAAAVVAMPDARSRREGVRLFVAARWETPSSSPRCASSSRRAESLNSNGPNESRS